MRRIRWMNYKSCNYLDSEIWIKSMWNKQQLDQWKAKKKNALFWLNISKKNTTWCRDFAFIILEAEWLDRIREFCPWSPSPLLSCALRLWSRFRPPRKLEGISHETDNKQIVLQRRPASEWSGQVQNHITWTYRTGWGAQFHHIPSEPKWLDGPGPNDKNKTLCICLWQ